MDFSSRKVYVSKVRRIFQSNANLIFEQKFLSRFKNLHEINDSGLTN